MGQVRSSLHGRWSHVLVDESQDTNPCQFELVKALTGPGCNLFMVGDPDQVGHKGVRVGGCAWGLVGGSGVSGCGAVQGFRV